MPDNRSELEKIPIIAKGSIMAGGLGMVLTMNLDEHLRFLTMCGIAMVLALGIACCGMLAERAEGAEEKEG